MLSINYTSSGMNASGDGNLSHKPRIFKKEKILKENMGVFWQSKKKLWIIRQFFIEWSYWCVFSFSKIIFSEKITCKALFILDSATGHDFALAQSLETQFKFIKLESRPSKTTSLLQLMDQQEIMNLKKLYTKICLQCVMK